ncbi:DUF5816 domain-containing protein [Candidatus Halobonum tyrrellensis]|uniref:GNAT family acetyltransferase n=1 Tax=Candidatus Halobonum tyrrellensis G22 TaxID=1324957 RepID=V4H8X1_9EURY|nr:DUF5816 domain-containing protein [Candidatus Halobonum tyrrellensis]ESP87165.1 hypothetical protein K933_15590 [Candidatus Halobonum tyrrellensis G22]
MELEVVETPAGALYVDRANGERGEKAPFFHVYADEAGETRWGYFCGNCETVNNAMDSMGRIECNECGNIRKPEEWDAAHE